MKTISIGGAVAILVTGTAFAQAAPTPLTSPVAPHSRMAKPQTRADVQARVQRMFARLDANRDGFIDKAEADAIKTKMAGKMQKGAGEGAQKFDRSRMFDRFDTNHDGMISREEFASAPRPERSGMRQAGMHRGFGGHMFEMADLNKDGRVSLAEAQQAALQHFGRADLNHDGTLTPEERSQAHQLMHRQRRPS
jgi:Ca2+-binding EF-hand superfamily protein